MSKFQNLNTKQNAVVTSNLNFGVVGRLLLDACYLECIFDDFKNLYATF